MWWQCERTLRLEGLEALERAARPRSWPSPIGLDGCTTATLQGALTLGHVYYLRTIMLQVSRSGPTGRPFVRVWPKAPGAPAAYSAAPDQIVLGRALAARVIEATRLTAEAAAAEGLFDSGSRRFAKYIHEVHRLTTRAIARFMITGQGTTQTERNFIGRLGLVASQRGLSLFTLTRSYLLWRDTNLFVLNQEIRRLGTSLAVAREARMIVRSMAKTGIERLALAYDRSSLRPSALESPARSRQSSRQAS